MKAFSALVLLALISGQAHASYYQIDCSNGSGSIKMQSGHSVNKVTVESISYKTGNPVRSRIELENQAVDKKVLKKTEIEKDSKSVCPEGSDSGYATWREVTVQKVQLTRADGKAFPEGSAGLKADGSIETTLICETNGSSLNDCN